METLHYRRQGAANTACNKSRLEIRAKQELSTGTIKKVTCRHCLFLLGSGHWHGTSEQTKAKAQTRLKNLPVYYNGVLQTPPIIGQL